MRWVVVGCGTVIAFDAVGSFASEQLGFEYGYLFPFSWAIYAVFAFLATRDTSSRRAGVWTGAAVALAESTVGWAVSAAIGPGAVDGEGPAFFAFIVLIVVGTGALVGLAAGSLALRIAGRNSRASVGDV